MTNAKNIIKMIATVNSDDDDGLNLIDAHVYVYLNLFEGFRVSIHKDGRSITYRHISWKPEDQSVLYHLFDKHRYTRSRNLLKSIRPEGWSIYGGFFGKYAEYEAMNITGGKEMITRFNSGDNLLEELAELHVIIQAIEYERQKGKEDV